MRRNFSPRRLGVASGFLRFVRPTISLKPSALLQSSVQSSLLMEACRTGFFQGNLKVWYSLPWSTPRGSNKAATKPRYKGTMGQYALGIVPG